MVKPQYRDRHIQIYLHNEGDKPRWQAIADKAGVSLSKLIVEAVEDFIIHRNLPQEIESAKLREENAQLRLEVNKQSQKITKLEEDRRTLTHMEFVKILQSNALPDLGVVKLFTKNVNTKEFLEALKGSTIDQLKILEQAGLVVETKYGWRVNK
jgi:hypothetical protein